MIALQLILVELLSNVQLYAYFHWYRDNKTRWYDDNSSIGIGFNCYLSIPQISFYSTVLDK